MINVRRIYDPVNEKDGARILVDRLWPRGVSKEKAKLDLWLKEIAPSTGLRKWFDHDPSKWQTFKEKYLTELKSNKEAIIKLKKVAEENQNVTILYAAKDREHNEALIVKNFLENQDK